MVSPTQGTLLMILGTLAMAGAAAMIAGIDGEPLSVAAWRCLLAVPMLAPLAWWEFRRLRLTSPAAQGRGRRVPLLPRRTVIGAVAAGAALGADYSFYNAAIDGIGPGLATVLINLQLAFLPMIAWAVDGVRPLAQLGVIVPLMLFGVAMTAGLIGPALFRDSGGSEGAPGDVALSGVLAGVAAGAGYATYLAVIRRTAPVGSRPAPFTVLTLVCLSAGVMCLLAALVSGRLTLPLGWAEWGGLLALALVGQVITYLCFNTAMTAVSETTSSTLMLLSAVFALAMSAAFFGELPTAWQLAGCVLILAGAWWAALITARHARTVRRLRGSG